MVLLAAGLAGCATAKHPSGSYVSKMPEPERFGVYHKVKHGETVWRIAKTYGVSIDDIVQSNNIPNVAQVEDDQLLFIPGASQVKEIVQTLEDKSNDFIWPLKGKVIKYFKQNEHGRPYKGIGIQADAGTPVKAALTGRVVFADYLTGYGYVVILEHNDGFYTMYGRNAELLVKLGDLVVKGTDIAHVGAINNLAYLHFEIRKNQVEDNPLYYLP